MPVDNTDLVALSKNLRELARRDPVTANEIVGEGADMHADLSRRSVRVDTGQLRTSIRSEHTGNMHTVKATAPHARDVEYGTVSGPPSIEELKVWCRRHGMDEGLAYPIRKNIMSRGYATLPEPFMRPPIPRVVRHIAEQSAKRLGDIDG